MIYRTVDKNNHLDHHRIGQFRRLLKDLVFKELHLCGRLYSWSNERSHPTLERIDRMFISNDWEDLFLRCNLHALSSHCSDHAPLQLCFDSEPSGQRWFMFWAFCTKCPGFLKVMQRAWLCPLRNASPFAHLDWLFRNTARFLKSWSDRFIGNIWLQVAIAKEVLSRLKATGDHRSLATHEDKVWKETKLKILGLSSLQHTIARQESRLVCLREGDAPRQFFHAKAIPLSLKKPRPQPSSTSLMRSWPRCRLTRGVSSWTS
jgi:hypothetical protein